MSCLLSCLVWFGLGFIELFPTVEEEEAEAGFMLVIVYGYMYIEMDKMDK